MDSESAKAPCIWRTYGIKQIGYAPCSAVYWHLSEAYNFCPFCGAKIKVAHNLDGSTAIQGDRKMPVIHCVGSTPPPLGEMVVVLIPGHEPFIAKHIHAVGHDWWMLDESHFREYRVGHMWAHCPRLPAHLDKPKPSNPKITGQAPEENRHG